MRKIKQLSNVKKQSPEDKDKHKDKYKDKDRDKYKSKDQKIHLIYVITRTSQRPYFFHKNYESIHSQTYPYIKHYVSCDDDETEEYVKQYPDLEYFWNWVTAYSPINQSSPGE